MPSDSQTTSAVPASAGSKGTTPKPKKHKHDDHDCDVPDGDGSVQEV